MTPAELLEIIYRYYPRGVAQGDPRRKDTPEHRRLTEARLTAGKQRKKWLNMVARLRARFPECTIYGDATHLLAQVHAACYPGTLCLPRAKDRHDYRVEFQVSFLAPYYVLCSQRYFSVESNKPPVLSFSPDDSDQPYWDTIAKEIESTYDAAPMPPEIGSVIVPDVQPWDRPMCETMIYDCFFDDCPRLIEGEDEFALQLQREYAKLKRR